MKAARKLECSFFQVGALRSHRPFGENVLPCRSANTLPRGNPPLKIMLRLKTRAGWIAGFRYYMPSQLSGRHEKTAAVARRFWPWTPIILFFDEPSADSIPYSPPASINSSSNSASFRMTIIVVTHELASAYLIAIAWFCIGQG